MKKAEIQQHLFHEAVSANDIELLCKKISSSKLNEKVEYRNPYKSIPIAAVGAVFSLNVRPAAWSNVVNHFCDEVSWDRDAEGYSQSSDQFLTKLPPKISKSVAKKYFNNTQRTSAKNGILKADAAVQFIKVLSNHGVGCKKDLTSGKIIERFRDIRQIKGQYSGISFVFFLMLAGFEDFVKPDRQVQNFVSKYLKRKVRPTYAAEVVRQAAYQLNLVPTELDLAVFSSMTMR